MLATLVSLAAIAATKSESVSPGSGLEPIGENVRPYPYISADSRARVYFKMLPGKEGQTTSQSGAGRAYRVGLKDDKLLWKTEGWFSWNTHLGAAGRILVRIESFFESGLPSTEDIGIAFYDKGKLVRSYSTKEILKDRPWNAQFFLARPQPFIHTDRPNGFILVENSGSADILGFELFTCDNYRSLFNVRTGELIRQNLLQDRQDD